MCRDQCHHRLEQTLVNIKHIAVIRPEIHCHALSIGDKKQVRIQDLCKGAPMRDFADIAEQQLSCS